MYAGQSLAAYPFSRGEPTAIRSKAQVLKNALGLGGSSVFVSSTTVTPTGSQVFNGTGALTDLTYTLRFFNQAADGSALSDVDNVTQFNNNNYWWNRQDNTATKSPADVASSPGPLLRNLAAQVIAIQNAGGRIDFYVWDQGQASDVSASSNRPGYKGDLGSVFNYLRSLTGEQTPIFIQSLGRHARNAGTGYTAIRQIQAELADEMPNIYLAGETYSERMAQQRTITDCVITAGSDVITTTSSISGVVAGHRIEGPGLPVNARVASVTSGSPNTIRLSTQVGAVAGDGLATESSAAATIYQLDDVHPYPGATQSANQTDGFYSIEDRVMRFIAKHFGASISGVIGPRATGVQATAGNAYIDVTITHDGGTDFTVGSNNPAMWTLLVNGVARQVTTQTRINAGLVRLGFVTALALNDAISLDPAGGYMNALDYTKVLRDNSSPSMPLRTAKSPLSATAT